VAATAITAALMLPEGTAGMTEASTTRRRSTAVTGSFRRAVLEFLVRRQALSGELRESMLALSARTLYRCTMRATRPQQPSSR
jgi:hypothetical protein